MPALCRALPVMSLKNQVAEKSLVQEMPSDSLVMIPAPEQLPMGIEVEAFTQADLLPETFTRPGRPGTLVSQQPGLLGIDPSSQPGEVGIELVVPPQVIGQIRFKRRPRAMDSVE